MVRALLTLQEEDKEWLEKDSRSHHRSFAETVRMAIHWYRQKCERETRRKTLKESSGLWKHKKISSHDYVRKLREEWE